jgi:hypothetical protein
VGRVSAVRLTPTLAALATLTLVPAATGGITYPAGEVAAAPPPVRILALGDFGVGGTTERAMGDALRRYEAQHPADALLTLGDNDYTGRPRAFHRNWTAAFSWLGAAGVAPAGTLGNHDVRVDAGRYEFDELNMPRGRFSRVIGPVEVFVLNSNRVTRRQTRWLARRLAASTATWKIVALHHPPYTCGGYLGNTAVQRRWVPVFERRGVAVVLSGHDHNYQRFAPGDGVRYIVHGGGGQELYPLRACPSGYPRRASARRAHGFLAIGASESRFVVRVLRPSGRLVDRLVIYP